MTSAGDRAAALVDAAAALGPLIQASADQIEESRRLTPSIVNALAVAGFFRMTVPRALGGGEIDPETIVRVIEEVSKADGSVGWSVMVAATTGMCSGLLAEDAAREIFIHDPGANAGVCVSPNGRALAVEGGYRVTGRWAFASSCMHATWIGGACRIYDHDSLRLDCDGNEETHFMFFPAAQCQILDTWRVTGLRGTGSHDFCVSDVFVPEPHVVRWSPEKWRPRQPGPLYAFGFSLVPIAFAAIFLGIARNAIDAVVELAAQKTRGNGKLRDVELTQVQVAFAEGHLGAARAYLLEMVRDVWKTATESRPISTRQRTLVHLASVHAATLATQAIDMMWDAAGSSAIYTSSHLDRCFRDAHTGRKNIAIYPENYAKFGRLFLGLEA
jgi:indole-3-acetate monooxygenase